MGNIGRFAVTFVLVFISVNACGKVLLVNKYNDKSQVNVFLMAVCMTNKQKYQWTDDIHV